MEVTTEDLKTTLVGLGDASGSASFGSDWAITAVRVREGEILLARRVGQAGPVYVVWFTVVSGMKYEIQYAVAPFAGSAPHGINQNKDSRGPTSFLNFPRQARVPLG